LTDGIGRREERPKKTELAWFTEESNRFGTDEYIEYCRVLGTEPYICVNMGTGTIDEAQAWVEYCNGADTYWANLRRQNGHEEPVVLDAYVECGKHALEDEASFWPLRVADMGPFDVLDSSATRDESGRDLTLVVVNRDPERDIHTDLRTAHRRGLRRDRHGVRGHGRRARRHQRFRPGEGRDERALRGGKGRFL
jgi:alpha-L-arabinofuranosidase